jgi:ParB-like chromosome segregation protein Spo0J
MGWREVSAGWEGQMKTLPVHEAAAIFPMMSEEEVGRLVEDIKKHGQLVPIALYAGRVLDGRNRLAACKLAGVVPVTQDMTASVNKRGGPVNYVLSANLERRHLDESQRAMVAARLATMGRGRQAANPSIEGFSQPDAAARLNVGRASVERARTVIDSGVPELVQAVDRGEIAVSLASKAATLPKTKLEAAVAGGRKAVKEAVREASPDPPMHKPVRWDEDETCAELHRVMGEAWDAWDGRPSARRLRDVLALWIAKFEEGKSNVA